MFIVRKPGLGFWTGSSWDKDICHAAIVSDGVVTLLKFLYGDNLESLTVVAIEVCPTHPN